MIERNKNGNRHTIGNTCLYVEIVDVEVIGCRNVDEYSKAITYLARGNPMSLCSSHLYSTPSQFLPSQSIIIVVVILIICLSCDLKQKNKILKKASCRSGIISPWVWNKLLCLKTCQLLDWCHQIEPWPSHDPNSWPWTMRPYILVKASQLAILPPTQWIWCSYIS